MRKHLIFTALFTALCLILTLLPPAGLAAGTARSVIPAGNEQDGVRKAVEQAQSDDIIEISGTGFVNNTESNAAPWVIDKAVTIRGVTEDATLNLRAGGILLGANVTFENLKLSFANRVRNVIMANGYTLTLTNVTRDTSAKKVHLLCGGLTNSIHNDAVPPSGPHGRIVIQDCSGLGNVYAGSLSGNLPGTNSFDVPATVTIISGEPGSLEALYGCGALESPVDDNWFDSEEPAPPAPSTESYPVNGPVLFEPYHTTVSRINGATGGSRDAAVSYTGGEDPNAALILQNISSLSLAAGELIPAPGSSFHADTDLTVPKDTILGTVNLGAAPSVGSFTGGGTLVLGESQTLTIQDSVSGTTAVAVGSILQSGNSGTVIQQGSVLLKTSSAAQDAFRLIPYSNQPNMTLVLKETGDWVAQDLSVEEPILVETLKIQDVTAPTNQTEITIPYEEITFGAGSAEDSSLSYVPLTMLINSKEANRLEDQGSYAYTWNSVDASLLVEVYDDSLFLTEGNGGTIPAGTYLFNLSIPKANSASGAFFSVEFTLTVSDDAPTLRPVAVPMAIPGLTYTGQVQTGVAEGEGYTLTGHQAAEVGTHTATAILQSGFQWDDGSMDDQTIVWSIGKAGGPAAPVGLTVSAPTSETGADGKITGTTSAMEYAVDSAFTDPKPCTDGETTGLTAGTYYVRLKETDTHRAGAAATVTVPAYEARPSQPTGGGGGGTYTPTYPPTVENPSEGGGTPAVSPSNPKPGDAVTVKPRPNEGYEVDKITVTDQNGKPVEVTVKPDGTYTFKQPNGKVTIEVSYKAIEKPWNNPFADVSEGDWYYEAVRFVQERGLMNGYSDGRFGPDDTLSRAQLAQILFNKEGRPGVNYLMDFSDVAGEAWYTEAIRWATSQGIVGGYGNGTFGPNDPITREQLAVMLWRYSGSPAATSRELHFADADEISGFALEALRWAVENGILNGYGDGRLGPQGQATRAQVAQMLKNFIEDQENKNNT